MKFGVAIEKDDYGYYAFYPTMKGCHTKEELLEEVLNNIQGSGGAISGNDVVSRWRGTEVVITALTRNQMVGFSGTWVRIPPSPSIRNFDI